MLYNFEKDSLNSQNVLREAVEMTETLCDEFSLENHFATISLTLQELLSLIIVENNMDIEYSLNAIVEQDEIAFQVRTDKNLSFLEKDLFQTESGLIITSLSDEVEISEDYSSICIMFHVKPNKKSDIQGRDETYRESMKKFLYTEEEVEEIKQRLKKNNLHI